MSLVSYNLNMIFFRGGGDGVCVWSLAFILLLVLSDSEICHSLFHWFEKVLSHYCFKYFFPFGSLFRYSNYKYVTCYDIISHFLDNLFFGFFFSFVSSLNFSLRRFFWHLLVRCFFPWLWAIGEYTDEPIKGILHPCPTGFLIVCLLLRLFFRVVSGIGQNWAESIEVFHLFLYMHSLSHYQPE